MKTIIVQENENMRLDKWIAKKCDDLSRTRLQKLIEEEKIFINGVSRQSIIKSETRR
ncbi:MAG: hypothetical protein HFJ27_02950 [Clostridia bacterium]|nr:hypothetical protein [Clostridia bacterium]